MNIRRGVTGLLIGLAGALIYRIDEATGIFLMASAACCIWND